PQTHADLVHAFGVAGADGRRIATDLRQAFEHRRAERLFHCHAPAEMHLTGGNRARVGVGGARAVGADDGDSRFHQRIIPHAGLTGNPAFASAALASAIVASPKWKIEAASTAEA